MSTADLLAFDREAAKIGAWPRERFDRELRKLDTAGQRRLGLLRYRWRLDEFAQDVIGPILARTDLLSPPCPLDDAIYSLPLYRPGDSRRFGFQSLIMTGRGLGKTTRQKIRRLHAMLYGLTRVSAAIAQTDPDAQAWIEAIAEWLDEPSAALRALFPKTGHTYSTSKITTRTPFGEATLFAKTWGGSLRGFNHRGVRPDAIDLDDIESEEKSATKDSRDKTQIRLLGKVLPLGNKQGGLDVIWTQTPVHSDAVAARAAKRLPELRAWQVTSLPVITRWPKSPLWDEAEALYFDADARPDAGDRAMAVAQLYTSNREEMDAGAECLDPVGMGPLQCHLKRWQVGPSAWKREYEMSTREPGAVLDPSVWPRHAVEHLGAGVVQLRPDHTPNAVIDLTRVPLWAHLDPSDGGDAAALVIAAWAQGRVYEVHSRLWERAQLSTVLATIAEELRPYAAAGLPALHWEPPSGAASVVEDGLRDALADAGVSLELVPLPSTEVKEPRITNTLEPLGAGKLLSLSHHVPDRAVAQAGSFLPHKRNNDDDWLDAFQRCCEGLIGGTKIHDPVEELAREMGFMGGAV